MPAFWIKRIRTKKPLNLVNSVLGRLLNTLRKHKGTSSNGLATTSHSLPPPPAVGICFPTTEQNKRKAFPPPASQLQCLWSIKIRVQIRALPTLKPMEVTCPEATYSPSLERTTEVMLSVWPRKKVCCLSCSF